jgi:hypothetical protein
MLKAAVTRGGPFSGARHVDSTLEVVSPPGRLWGDQPAKDGELYRAKAQMPEICHRSPDLVEEVRHHREHDGIANES